MQAGSVRRRARKQRRPLALLVLLLPAARPALAAKPVFEIAPGPPRMPEEEKALAADPARRVEHGVVLIEEGAFDDSLGTHHEASYHLRAKILSPEARGLADVMIPFNSKAGFLKQWWGRTILPDGTVVSLRQEDLHPQTVVRVGGREAQVLKGALPGVVPGCVVDYGYVFWDEGVPFSEWIALQQRWPVRLIRFRWIPWDAAPARLGSWSSRASASSRRPSPSCAASGRPRRPRPPGR